MSRYVEVMAIVEGSTEETFINRILAPYLSHRNIGMRATQVSKPGEKGGDVKFSRVKNDIRLHLKQRPDTIVATFLDYYGIKEWPGLESIPSNPTPSQIESMLCTSTMSEMKSFLHSMAIEHRFIPFFIIHEFETLLFSSPEILASGIGISKGEVDKTISQFHGDVERINNSKETAPSKRLEGWRPRYRKIGTGIPIAERIGIDQMRACVPLFNEWLSRIEATTEYEWI